MNRDASVLAFALGRRFALVGAAFVSVAQAVHAQPCQSYWADPTSNLQLLTTECRILTFDDGAGLALYAAGPLWFSGGPYERAIVRWNGHEWARVGPAIPHNGGDEGPWITVLDGGAGPHLYASGDYYDLTAPASRVFWNLVWNGSAWEPAPSWTFYDG